MARQVLKLPGERVCKGSLGLDEKMLPQVLLSLETVGNQW